MSLTACAPNSDKPQVQRRWNIPAGCIGSRWGRSGPLRLPGIPPESLNPLGITLHERVFFQQTRSALESTLENDDSGRLKGIRFEHAPTSLTPPCHTRSLLFARSVPRMTTPGRHLKTAWNLDFDGPHHLNNCFSDPGWKAQKPKKLLKTESIARRGLLLLYQTNCRCMERNSLCLCDSGRKRFGRTPSRERRRYVRHSGRVLARR